MTASAIITSSIYRKLGYTTSETRLIHIDGIRYTASKELIGIIPTYSDLLKSSQARKLKIFAALLHDWDRLSPDNNRVLPNGNLGLLNTISVLGFMKLDDFKNTTSFYDVYMNFKTPFVDLTHDDAVEAVQDLKKLDRKSIEGIVNLAQYSSKSNTQHMIDSIWNRKTAIENHLLHQFPSAAPSEAEIKNRIFAVHATDTPPRSHLSAGALSYGKQAAFVNRHTVHFSLGELVRPHDDFSWENKKFAVLTTLENLKPQLVNLHPFDSFIMGDFQIPPGSTILVPLGYPMHERPEYTYVYYTGLLRIAIDKQIELQNGWHIRMDEATKTARLGGVNLDNEKFFKNFLKDTNISFGIAAHSWVGEADRLAKMEFLLIDYIQSYYTYDVRPSHSTQEIEVVQYYLKFQMNKIEKYLKTLSNYQNIESRFEEQKNYFNKLMTLIDTDLQIRAATGRTVQNSLQYILDQFTKLIWSTQQEGKVIVDNISKNQALNHIPADDYNKTFNLFVHLSASLSPQEAVEFVHLHMTFGSPMNENFTFSTINSLREERAKYFSPKYSGPDTIHSQ